MVQGCAHGRLQRRRAKHTYEYNNRTVNRPGQSARGKHRERFKLCAATNEFKHSTFASLQIDRQCHFDIRRGERVRQGVGGSW